jgi:uncharacterized protein
MDSSKTKSAIDTKKPDISYPCQWQYKVIGQNPETTKKAIKDACSPAQVTITFSHVSSSGKYHSFNAEVIVKTEEQRLKIYQALHNHPDVKMVL